MSIRDPRRRFGVLCVLAYVALAWAVRFDMRRGTQAASLVYPLDTFSMYATLPDYHTSHLLVRDAHGTTWSVTAFAGFDCAGSIQEHLGRCTADHQIAYHYEDLVHYITSHPGAGDEDVELISRTWHIRPGAPAEVAGDCVIARCRVVR